MRWSNPPWNERRYGKMSIEKSRKSISPKKWKKLNLNMWKVYEFVPSIIQILEFYQSSKIYLHLPWYANLERSHPFKKNMKNMKKNLKTFPSLYRVTIHNKKKNLNLFPIPSCIVVLPFFSPLLLPWPTWDVRTARDRSSKEAIREACRRHPNRAKRWWLKTNGNRKPPNRV